MLVVVALLRAAAVLVLMLAGIATVLSATATRSTLLRVAAVLFLLSLFIPYAAAVVIRALGDIALPAVSSTTVIAVVFGHIVLTGALLARRLRAKTSTIEGARGRERPRLPPQE